MLSKIFNILIVLMVVFMASCDSKTNSDDQTIESNYSFLKIGSQWNYDFKAEGAQSSIQLNYQITGRDENGFFEVLMESSVGGEANYYWYSNENLFAEESGAFPPDYVFALIPANAKVGDKWSAVEEDEELGEISREILNISEEVNVPAGTFDNCIKVKETFSDDDGIVNYYWFSIDYGIVKKLSTGWADIDDSPRIYFDIDIKLIDYNF